MVALKVYLTVELCDSHRSFQRLHSIVTAMAAPRRQPVKL